MIDSTRINSGIGATEVSLCYYRCDEHNKLTPEQKKELHEWRESDLNSKKRKFDYKKGIHTPSSGGSDNKNIIRMKILISLAVTKELDLRKCSTAEFDTNQNTKDGAYLLSLVQAHASSATTTITATAPPHVTTYMPKQPTAVNL